MEITQSIDNLAIMLTEKCNNYCYHCFRPLTHQSSILNYETICSLSEKLVESSIKNVRFTGGEPLLFPRIDSIIKEFTVKGFKVSIGTNATLINDGMIAILKDSGLAEIWTTIHSYDAILHDRLAGRKGAFSKTIDAIVKLLHAGIKTCVNIPVSSYNRPVFLQTVFFLKGLGVDRIKILKITPLGRANNGSFKLLDEKEWEGVISELANQNFSGFDIKIQGCKPLSLSDGHCNIYPIKHLNISPLGIISPCCLLNNSNQFEIGNISELLSMSFENAIQLFNARIKLEMTALENGFPCLRWLQDKKVCPLYSRYTIPEDI